MIGGCFCLFGESTAAAEEGLGGDQHIGGLTLAVYGDGYKSAGLDVIHAAGFLAALDFYGDVGFTDIQGGYVFLRAKFSKFIPPWPA